MFRILTLLSRWLVNTVALPSQMPVQKSEGTRSTVAKRQLPSCGAVNRGRLLVAANHMDTEPKAYSNPETPKSVPINPKPRKTLNPKS